MAKTDMWAVIAAERAALAADLKTISSDEWSHSSLCGDWTVRDVLAHMTATAKINGPAFFTKLLAAGGSFPRLQAKDIATEKGASPDDTLARFEAVVDSRRHPPGPTDTMIGETIVHAEDIRRPLGIRHDYRVASVVQVADFYKGSNLILGTKRRIAGLRLQATDTDWAHGTGPEVSGPILSLVMAMTGRKEASADLSGNGVTQLQERP